MKFLSLLLLIVLFSINVDACSLKFGAVPQFDQRTLFAIWTPIIKHIGKSINCDITIVGSENINTFEEKFLNGELDIAYMNPYHAYIANKKQGYRPILRSGEKMLTGILVVNKDSGITTLQQLNNKVLAFPSPNALGASLLMRAELASKHNITFTEKYVKTHDSVYIHVAKNLVVAGGGVQRTLDLQEQAIKNKLKVIFRTTEVPSHPIVVSKKLSSQMIITIQEQLLNLAKVDPDLFAKIPMQNPIKTEIKDYKILQNLHLEKFAKN